jgi:predicted alpha/beta-hydrolase family hydrolase
VIRLVGAVAGPEAELFQELDQIEQLIDRLLWKKLVAKPDARSSHAVTLIRELDTPRGLARVHLHPADSPSTALVLGHGAGGGVQSPDLVGATRAAVEAGLTVALVEQPYRVAGQRSPAPARQLDEAWISVVRQLLDGLPLIVGGRSAGARVACRTAAETGAVAVLCLAFPVHPPGKPEKSRLAELDAVTVPTLVVQGERDPFGIPPEAPNRKVVLVPGTHSLRSNATVAAAVSDWLASVT